MHKFIKFIIIILLFQFSNSFYYGQRNYRLTIPTNVGSKFGKAPESGGDFLYLSNSSYTFYIDPYVNDYSAYSNAISSAFNSWYNASKVEFTEDTQGLKLTGDGLFGIMALLAWCDRC